MGSLGGGAQRIAAKAGQTYLVHVTRSFKSGTAGDTLDYSLTVANLTADLVRSLIAVFKVSVCSRAIKHLLLTSSATGPSAKCALGRCLHLRNSDARNTSILAI